MMTTIKNINRIIIVYLLDKSVKAINKVPIQKIVVLLLYENTHTLHIQVHIQLVKAIIIKAVKIINISVDIYLRVIFRHLSMLQHSYDI